MLDAPCFQCSARLLGCHAQCDKWLMWRDVKDKENETIRSNKEKEGVIIQYKKAVFVGINKRIQG